MNGVRSYLEGLRKNIMNSDIIGSTNFFDEVNLCIGLELELAAAIDEGQIL